MNLDDPVAIFTAESNTEALFLQQLLERAGIKAVCVEDNTDVGLSIGGDIPGLHNPQVWISRADTEFVSSLLERYEELRDSKQALRYADDAEQIEVVCDECDQVSSFSASLAGTVQECIRCATFLDVGEEEEDSMANEWDVPIDEEE
ncbi:MAG: DUF2007 domain-containing protein [Planctomycetaceae bacterium]|nr:DUF2007 domain-containing protein [Planctomycetaceae bacterium]MDC0274441.1 DUF2007 domain-containing protein [Planctomycetaceae bacterium]MDG2391271.1 DUF2007 domain-containing protein [Planctomycetaceae bacterium]